MSYLLTYENHPRIVRKVSYTRRFHKSIDKRFPPNTKIRRVVDRKIREFLWGKDLKLFRDHQLLGSMSGCRSLSLGYDIRLIYRMDGDFFEFLDIGTHSQVYK